MKRIRRESRRAMLLAGVLCGAAVFGGCAKEQMTLARTQEAAEEATADETADEAAPAEEAGSAAAGETETAGGEEGDRDAGQLVYVDVCGAVAKPGVYSLPEGSRVYEAIAAAGGALETAELTLLNQAAQIADGQQIRVYTKEEAEDLAAAPSADQTDASAGTGKININLADRETLMTLDGIGGAKADLIIAYRTEHGGFSSTEELMEIEGIKEKTYNKLKDKITVD